MLTSPVNSLARLLPCLLLLSLLPACATAKKWWAKGKPKDEAAAGPAFGSLSDIKRNRGGIQIDPNSKQFDSPLATKTFVENKVFQQKEFSTGGDRKQKSFLGSKEAYIKDASGLDRQSSFARQTSRFDRSASRLGNQVYQTGESRLSAQSARESSADSANEEGKTLSARSYGPAAKSLKANTQPQILKQYGDNSMSESEVRTTLMKD